MLDDGGEMKGGKSRESTLLYRVTLHSPGKEVEEHEFGPGHVAGPLGLPKSVTFIKILGYTF
jgi:hypothetical protein